MSRRLRTLRVGIASRDEQKARMLAIVRGEHKPGPQEPRVWFSSMESLAQVLSDKNLRLLDLIARDRPGSLTDLARLSGREKGNLSRTLRTMTHYGLVELRRREGGRVEPRVVYDEVRLAVPVGGNRRVA